MRQLALLAHLVRPRTAQLTAQLLAIFAALLGGHAYAQAGDGLYGTLSYQGFMGNLPFSVDLTFDQSAVTGNFYGPTLPRGHLVGKVERGVCTLKDEATAIIWTGSCSEDAFTGNFSRAGNRAATGSFRSARVDTRPEFTPVINPSPMSVAAPLAAEQERTLIERALFEDYSDNNSNAFKGGSVINIRSRPAAMGAQMVDADYSVVSRSTGEVSPWHVTAQIRGGSVSCLSFPNMNTCRKPSSSTRPIEDVSTESILASAKKAGETLSLARARSLTSADLVRYYGAGRKWLYETKSTLPNVDRAIGYLELANDAEKMTGFGRLHGAIQHAWAEAWERRSKLDGFASTITSFFAGSAAADQNRFGREKEEIFRASQETWGIKP